MDPFFDKSDIVEKTNQEPLISKQSDVKRTSKGCDNRQKENRQRKGDDFGLSTYGVDPFQTNRICRVLTISHGDSMEGYCTHENLGKTIVLPYLANKTGYHVGSTCMATSNWWILDTIAIASKGLSDQQRHKILTEG